MKTSQLIEDAISGAGTAPPSPRGAPAPRVLSGVAARVGSLSREAEETLARTQAELAALQAEYTGVTPIRLIDTALITPSPFQDRAETSLTAMDSAFQALTEDIRVNRGNLVPALLRPTGGGRYEIVYGHRRWKACVELGLPLKAEVRELDDEQLLRAMVKENRFRLDLTVYENLLSVRRARFLGGFAKLFEKQARLAEIFGVSQSYVSRLLQWEHVLSDIESVLQDPRGLTRRTWEAIAVAKAALPDSEAWDLRVRAAIETPGPDARKVSVLLGEGAPAALPSITTRLAADRVTFVVRADLSEPQADQLAAHIQTWLDRRPPP